MPSNLALDDRLLNGVAYRRAPHQRDTVNEALKGTFRAETPYSSSSSGHRLRPDLGLQGAAKR